MVANVCIVGGGVVPFLQVFNLFSTNMCIMCH